MSKEIISDEEMQAVETYHEQVIDAMVVMFRDLRVRDRAEGDDTDAGALGGIGMAFDKLGPASVTILGPLLVRRLAGVDVEPR